MHSSSDAFQSKTATAALALLALAIWLLLRGYHGLIGDAQLYAVQALARIHPQLTHDLYLQNTSQDQFTIFSPIYARFIDILGLERAARILTLMFTVWFLGAAWAICRVFASRNFAWLAVASLLIVTGSYGGAGVFRFAEEFLTARLPAEALIATSLACYLGGQRSVGMAITVAALFVHPLIALPGLLLLISLSLPVRSNIIGALGCVMIAVVITIAANRVAWIPAPLRIMDADWVNIVEERSQFLFLQLWSFKDWELNTRPFFYLAFITLAVQDARIRRLCFSAAVVGALGLTVALIAGTLGPVALLMQGQAWRWIWIAAFVSTLLLPLSIWEIWQDRSCGPLCALLLISGLTLPATNGTGCVSLAMFLWFFRSNTAARSKSFLLWISIALIAGLAAWMAVQSWQIVVPAAHASTAVGVTQIRDFFALRICAALAVLTTWACLSSGRTAVAPTCVCATLLGLSILILPTAFEQSRTLASTRDVAEFSDWANAIPPASTVLVTPARDVGTFVWFTLQRPNYLAVDQSAGVVFSRQTALEVQRRSQVLLPLMEPNWKILSGLRMAPTKRAGESSDRPLTAQILVQICEDPQLGFVISRQDFGFDRLIHTKAGAWMGWGLYDCRKARPTSPAT